MRTGKLVECYDVSKAFSGKLALDRVNLSVGRGKVIGLLGPNGSGKTTLIKLMNGLIRPTKGDIYIDGKKPGVYTKSIVSYLPDRTYFADWMTTRDMVNMFSEFYDDFDRYKAEKMCASLNISMGDRIKTMSKGTKEKVQLILVMSRKADLYLLDEPIAGVQRLYPHHHHQQLQRGGYGGHLHPSHLGHREDTGRGDIHQGRQDGET